jgi:hypothetical protein
MLSNDLHCIQIASTYAYTGVILLQTSTNSKTLMEKT